MSVYNLDEIDKNEQKLDAAVHLAVSDALEILDNYFGKGIIKDDIAYTLDKMVKTSIINRELPKPMFDSRLN